MFKVTLKLAVSLLMFLVGDSILMASPKCVSGETLESNNDTLGEVDITLEQGKKKPKTTKSDTKGNYEICFSEEVPPVEVTYDKEWPYLPNTVTRLAGGHECLPSNSPWRLVSCVHSNRLDQVDQFFINFN